MLARVLRVLRVLVLRVLRVCCVCVCFCVMRVCVCLGRHARVLGASRRSTLYVCCVRVCVDTCCVLGSPQLLATPGHHHGVCTCSTCTPDMIQTSKRYSVPTCSRTPCVESAHAEGRARACKIAHPINELERSNTYAGAGGHHLRRCWRTSSTPVLADIIYAGAGGHHLRQRAR